MGGQYELFRAPARATDKRDAKQAGRLEAILANYPLHDLARFHRTLAPEATTPSSKPRLVPLLAALFDVQTAEEFSSFVSRLRPPAGEVLAVCVFSGWLSLAELKRRWRLAPSSRDSLYPYGTREFPPEAGLGLFSLGREQDCIELAGWMRELFLPFLPKPEGWILGPCAAPVSGLWSNAGAIADSLPLFRRKLGDFLATTERAELARKGLKKSAAAELRAASGLPRFGLADAEGLDSAELLARFLALFDIGPLEGGGEGAIKTLVERFFSGMPRGKVKGSNPAEMELQYYARHADSRYELDALTDHLTRRPGSSPAPYNGLCPSRRDFRAALEVLEALEKVSPGSWAEARALFEYLRLRMGAFSITDPESEYWILGIKAEKAAWNGLEETRDSWEKRFPITVQRRIECVARPVFEQYVYLFAVLGLLEIAEAEAPRPLVRRGKAEAICPADCLAALRLTPLGRWCLGYLEAPPARAAGNFEAIADSELLLVTFRGASLERRLYLDLVATAIGPERWRFTEARFIEGCDSPRKIEEREADFLRLIEPEPSERWLAFFRSVRERAKILPAMEAAVLIRLPSDPGIRRIFVERPRIRALARRVEDGSVAVRFDDLPALTKLLRAEGFWAPEAPRKKRRRGEDWE